MEGLLLVLLFIAFVWLSGVSWYLWRLSMHYNKLIGGTSRVGLQEILDQILSHQKLDRDTLADLSRQLDKLTDQILHSVQKVGILRFNPFADTGGDQSFVLAILDGTDNGVVLTSLHSRDATRWYAKNVKDGSGVEHELSDVEIKAIKNAVPLITNKKIIHSSENIRGKLRAHSKITNT
jgi:hypothetical protein